MAEELPPIGRSIHVSETSNEYNSFRAESSLSTGTSLDPFGKRELEKLALLNVGTGMSILERMAQQKGLPSNEQRRVSIFSSIRTSLQEVHQDKNRKQFVDELFRKAHIDPSTITSLAEVDDTNLERMLKVHVEEFQKRSQQFEDELPVMVDQFKQKFSELRDKGFHHLTDDQIESRLRNTKVKLVDALVVNPRETWGEFRFEEELIGLVEQAPGEMREHILTHELLHALSGRTILAEDLGVTIPTFDEDSGEEKEEPLINVSHQRIGLSFNTPSLRFNWLNEAVTQELTQLLTNESPVYRKERRVLAELIKHSNGALQLTDFIHAFFENYETDEDKVPEWKALSKRIDEAYVPGALLELDKVIEKNGISIGLDYVRLMAG